MKTFGTTICSYLKAFLKFLSVGKYSTVLYLRGTNLRSSIFGGIFSLILGVALLTYSILLLTTIFSREHYNIDTFTRPYSFY